MWRGWGVGRGLFGWALNYNCGRSVKLDGFISIDFGWCVSNFNGPNKY